MVAALRSHPRAGAFAALVAALAAAGLLLALGGAPSAVAGRTAAVSTPAVPQGFVGVDLDGPLIDSGTTLSLPNQMGSMVHDGVQSIRIAFNWAAAEPYRTWSDVPTADKRQFTSVAGKPFDFRTTDAVVADAARRRLVVLPTVLYAPSWDSVRNPDGVAYPRTAGPYAAYLTALIGRYGPNGSFWRANPSIHKQPIREWQIWNEPNQDYYWKQPFVAGYVSLLRASHAAIRRADPGAKVVLGALTNRAWKSLAQIYAHPGARSLFDIVAVNGFTSQPANVIRYLRFVRNAMARGGDRDKSLLATEVSWPSSLGHTTRHYDFDTTQAGQARDIAALLPMLGAERASLRLVGFDYYTWIGAESRGAPEFNFAGLMALRDGTVHVKPALAAYRIGALALEHCARKGSLATSCIK